MVDSPALVAAAATQIVSVPGVRPLRLWPLKKVHRLLFGDASTQTVGTAIDSTVRPIALAPIIAIGGQVRYGIQVSARALETTITEA
ncbi:MAG: hypothetical protein ACLP36_07250, partial [Acidimicrobiales bacterium]